ncbi:hypothetical protein [Bacillus sp. FJAT-22090]|uniref:hypothetical protein n=1 Tax=Bacillus sp. FJAT-22090 TaxID=1581038 RepID=UPI0011A41004|nr:hypothetical protein [Bacillus sp. FJAT-22090]
MDEKDFYIFGEPVETEFGEVRFLTYVEYLHNLTELSAMSQNVLHIYYQYKNHYDSIKLDEHLKAQIEESLEALKKESLYNIVKENKELKSDYQKIFDLVIGNKEIIDVIFSDEQLFMKFRKLILDMNMMTESLVSPNPEIQKGIERSRRVKQNSSKDKQSFGDIVSSIVVGAGILPQDVAHMTVLQVYSTYYRISRFQSYNTSTLFATVAEKVEIESWSAHIDLWEKEKDGMEKSEFDKKFGNIF